MRLASAVKRIVPDIKVGDLGDIDLEEILHLLRDRPSGTLVRSSKTRAMFAMRACRKSTMVGAPLNVKQMTTVSFPAFFTRHGPFFSWLVG